jgi:hypothetical protein
LISSSIRRGRMRSRLFGAVIFRGLSADEMAIEHGEIHALKLPKRGTFRDSEIYPKTRRNATKN